MLFAFADGAVIANNQRILEFKFLAQGSVEMTRISKNQYKEKTVMKSAVMSTTENELGSEPVIHVDAIACTSISE